MSRVWVIGGTKDARQLIDALVEKGIFPIVTVATEYGKELLSGKIQVFVKRMTFEEMIYFIKENDVYKVIDASHPYAIEVSQNAIQASAQCHVSYMRFERAGMVVEHATHVNSHEEAAEYLLKTEGKILLTTGSNTLSVYTERIEVERLIVRVLPTSGVLLKCEQLGLTPENIFAMKGPFTKEMNMSILRQTGAKIMVTKDSGEVGGMAEKIEATKETGTQFVVVGRPKLAYPRVCTSIDDILLTIK